MTTTLGRYLLNEAIPSGYQPDGVATKGQLQRNMSRLAKDDPEKFLTSITKMKEVGDLVSTLEGVSVGLDDIQPIYAKRDKILKPALNAVKAATTVEAKRKIILKTQDQLLDYAQSHPGTMGDMTRAGARGNVLQLMRAVGAPAAVSDEHDRIQPWLITHSYSEGLRPSEWWAANREARMAAVKSNLGVAEPGDLSNIIANNTSGQVVTIHDCGTHNGLSFPVDSDHLLDRYLARSTGTYAAKTLLTTNVLSDLKKQGIKVVLARSPMTCEAEVGVCQLCMGLTSMGSLNDIGDNVGLRTGQALGEPLTQLALNAKHGVRASGKSTNELSGLAGFRAIIESPESFENKALLAPVKGKVNSVTKAPQGGYYVNVEGHSQHAIHGLKPLVKAGDDVYQGDVLTEGIPRPAEVVAYKGLGAGRDYVVQQLSSIYGKRGINVDRRHFEVLAKSTLNHVKVDEISPEAAAQTGWVRGDTLNYNKYKSVVSNSVKEVDIEDALGKPLGEGVLFHLVGTRVTVPMLVDFRRAGIKKVKITTTAPRVTPIMAPATRNPLLNTDWLARMGHRYLKQSLLEGAQLRQSTDIHGVHPTPALAFSSEFGEGSQGRY